MSMSEDDAAYSALLTQLLSGPASSRNARVHSWIEHQYDFAFSELAPPAPSSRTPSPSPSSSLGANRTHSIDRPDSPLLPRPSSPCPSYDALFFPPRHPTPEHEVFEEQERLRALRFIVQEMAHWKSQAPLPSPPHAHDKPLPAPPPSPASSLTQSTSSRIMRSRSSSMRISRLPSFTSTLSSDQSQPQEMPPPLPVSVVVHGELQHDLVLHHDHPLVNGYLHRRDDSLPLSHEHDSQLLCPIPDEKDALQLSPAFSNFSTSFTTSYASSPTSPSSVVFSSSSCSPENVALPASPVDDPPTRPLLERAPHQTALPLSAVAVSSPQTTLFPPANPIGQEPSTRLQAPKLLERSQSRWSVATTASLTPSATEPKARTLSDPRTPPKEKKEKSLKTPKKRTRFISLISRFSPSRNDVSTATMTSQLGLDVEYDSADSDAEDKYKYSQRKQLNKKSSLASLRPSFTLSRASFGSQRPTVSFSTEEAPPLPTSPTLTSPLADPVASPEITPPIPTTPLSRMSSRANVTDSALPPIPQSASTIASFQSSSQLSISDNSVVSASGSRISLVSPRTTPNMSRISLLPAPSKRTSLASAAGIEPIMFTHSLNANQATGRSKSIFRLAAKPKSSKVPLTDTKATATPSKLPVAGNPFLPPSATPHSRIPQAPTRFNPPAKLATVIATQSRPAPALASPVLSSPTSKLSMPPSRPPPKLPRSTTALEKLPMESLPSLPEPSRLPMPASTKGARVGTVKGFWKRQ